MNASESFLKADVQLPAESIKKNTNKGIPQGGVTSPMLANLYLNYVMDEWLWIHYPENPFERYADDEVVHCRSEREVIEIM